VTKHNQQFIRRLLTLFFPVAILLVASTVYLYQKSYETDKFKLMSSEMYKLSNGNNSIGHQIRMVSDDVHYLATQEGLIELISQEGEQKYNHLAKTWISLSKIKGIYDQIRWLDLTGMEQLRVNYNNGEPYRVSSEKLQNKSSRYYFKDTIKLPQGSFFVSPFDLNIENGQIENPQKPMIRIGSPIFDRQGNKQGIVLVNYLGKRLLGLYGKEIVEANSRAWLVNSQGYWLKGPKKELEWGFMYKNPKASMRNHYPQTWQYIKNKDNGQFENEQGIWTFATTYPFFEGQKSSTGLNVAYGANLTEKESHNDTWKSILFLPKAMYENAFKNQIMFIVVILLLVLIIIFIVFWLLVSAWQKHDDANDEIVKINATLEQRIKERTKELKEAKDVAEKQAGTDPLTGLENRLHLEHDIENAIKHHALYNAPYSLLLFDIDWFKKVNDNHGHDMGDVVLKQVASILKDIVREEDKVYRIGGEEFVVLLKRIEQKHIHRVAEKIRKNVELHLFDVGGSSINITISGGLHHSSIAKVNDYHDLLKIVDKALYQSKENGRNQITSHQAS